MEMKKLVAALFLALLLAGCAQGNETTEGGTFSYTPGELTYYINLPQDSHWSLSTYMQGTIDIILLSSTDLRSAQGYVLENDLFVNNGTFTLTSFSDSDAMEYPLYLYQSYQGMDWAEMARLKAQAQAGDTEAAARLAELEQCYAEEYATLSSDDLPQFYVYVLEMSHSYDGEGSAYRASSMNLTLGRNTVEVPLGTLDITCLPYWEGLPEAEEIACGDLGTAWASYWTDTAELPAVKIAATKEAQTLTGVAYCGGDVTLSNLVLTWTENGKTITQNWDGLSPITIPAGASATLTGIIHHGGKSVMGYCAGGYLAISREYEGENQRLWYSLPISQYWNLYELYAMVVDGIDLTAYYAYAYGYVPAEIAQEAEDIQAIDQLLREESGLTWTAVSAYGDEFAYNLTFELVNSTAEDVIFYQNITSVNGYSYSRAADSTACTVPAGACVLHTVSLAWENLAHDGISANAVEEIFLIDLQFGASIDEDEGFLFSDSRNRRTTALYPQGTEITPTPTITSGMTLLVETEQFQLWLVRCWRPQKTLFQTRSFDTDYYYGQFLLVNKSEEQFSAWVYVEAVNGEEMRSTWAGTVHAGRFKLYDTRLFQLSKLPSDILEEITFSYEISATAGSETGTFIYCPAVL